MIGAAGRLLAASEDQLGFAETLCWLWRFGPPSTEVAGRTLAIGGAADAARLSASVEAGELRGAVILLSEEGGGGSSPAARKVAGRAGFSAGTRVRDEFILLEGEGDPLSSTLGVHALRRDGVLFVGFDPRRDWGRTSSFWAVEAIAGFFEETLSRPLEKLPPIGCLRLDDWPGTAQQQLQGTAQGDSEQARRMRKLLRRLSRKDAVLNAAVAAQAFDGDRVVSLDQVWPESIATLSEGVRDGAIEPVVHGLLHLVPEEAREGRIEFREFADLSEEEALERLETAVGWHRRCFGTPRSFVAPAWAYSSGSVRAAAQLDLPIWRRPAAGPLLRGDELAETLIGELPGLDGLDYSPLQRLARAGVPPMVTLHGRLLDNRLPRLRGLRDLPARARLALSRDIFRLIRLDGIRWVGAGEMIDRLRGHGRDWA